MTRRSLFATLAAAIAGRKLLPPAPLPSLAKTLAGLDDYFFVSMLPEFDQANFQLATAYQHKSYAMGFKVSKAMLDSDPNLEAILRELGSEQRRREERLIVDFLG